MDRRPRAPALREGQRRRSPRPTQAQERDERVHPRLLRVVRQDTGKSRPAAANQPALAEPRAAEVGDRNAASAKTRDSTCVCASPLPEDPDPHPAAAGSTPAASRPGAAGRGCRRSGATRCRPTGPRRSSSPRQFRVRRTSEMAVRARAPRRWPQATARRRARARGPAPHGRRPPAPRRRSPGSLRTGRGVRGSGRPPASHRPRRASAGRRRRPGGRASGPRDRRGGRACAGQRPACGWSSVTQTQTCTPRCQAEYRRIRRRGLLRLVSVSSSSAPVCCRAAAGRRTSSSRASRWGVRHGSNAASRWTTARSRRQR